MNHGGISRRDRSISIAHACDRDLRFDPAGNRIEPQAVELGICYNKCTALECLDRRRFLSAKAAASRAGSTRKNCWSSRSAPMLPTIAAG